MRGERSFLTLSPPTDFLQSFGVYKPSRIPFLLPIRYLAKTQNGAMVFPLIIFDQSVELMFSPH